MFFSELYGAYYNTVAKIIGKAIESPLSRNEIRAIIEKNAFGESAFQMEEALCEEKWKILTKKGETPIQNPPTLPMTNLEKRWLKAISLDPRVQLFGEDFSDLEEVEPLFTPEDLYIFDQYADGDPYKEEGYQKNFRQILDAIHKKYPLNMKYRTGTAGELQEIFLPEYLEYSQKDDKFRLIGIGRKKGQIMNLARVISCEPWTGDYTPRTQTRCSEGKKTRTVEFEVSNERDTMERALMHFAHYEKQAEQVDCNRYRIRVVYESEDETELLIRILSFGPMFKVIGPDHFIYLIKNRLKRQKLSR